VKPLALHDFAPGRRPASSPTRISPSGGARRLRRRSAEAAQQLRRYEPLSDDRAYRRVRRARL